MGQITGTAYDAWTGEPLTATVELAGVYSMPARPDYDIWAPAGIYVLNAYAANYYTATQPVALIAGETVVQDMGLEPSLPRVEWTPAAVTATALQGSWAARAVTLFDTGPMPLDFAVHEISPTLMLRSPSAVDLSGKQILFDRAHGEPAMSDYDTLIADIVAGGATVTENWYFPIEPGVLSAYDVLWVNCCGSTNWGFSELTAVRDWLAQGGAVLVHGDGNAATSSLATVMGINYMAGSCTSGNTTNVSAHPISTGVDTVNVEYTCWRLAPAAGADIVVYDPQGQPHIVAH
jgi:hypothetical protein